MPSCGTGDLVACLLNATGDENFRNLGPQINMAYWERHLPHWIPEQVPIFVTWRLAGTLPRVAQQDWTTADAELDRAPGPRWLGEDRIARIVADALHYGETGRQFYKLHAWVVMPNHVHAFFNPQGEFSEIMQWIKWTTARRCNTALRRTGQPFWQDESYDHWVRNTKEFGRVMDYIEYNPVSAGLVDRPEDWKWSSAAK
jgi:putative transposase